MVFTERTVLQIFIIILTIKGLHSASRNRLKQLGVLSQLLPENSKTPLIVVVNTGKQVKPLSDDYVRDDEWDDAAEMDTYEDFDDNLTSDNYQSVLYDNLRTDKNVDNDEERLAQEKLIEKALHLRCQAKIECEDKCFAEAEEKPREFCEKNCKAAFDDFIKCPPPGNRETDKRKK